jgi:polyribonucleotide nucleotidyltransferase
MEKTSVSLDFAGQTLTLETGHLAPQATTSVLARLGDTMVLVTVVLGAEREDLGYFPLSVEYVERLYAGGRIKGSRWVKREGRPSDESILIGRLIDRSIRPLFPKDLKREIQVVVTVLSVDGENEPDILAINAVSAALAISNIPWNGPIGAIRMGYIQDPENGKKEFLLNPTTTEAEFSDLDLVVSQSNDLTVMIEAGANQVQEDVLLEAIERAQNETRKVIAFINDLAKKIGKPKLEFPVDQELKELSAIIEKSYKEEIKSLVTKLANKETGGTETEDLVVKIYEHEKMVDSTRELDTTLIAKALEAVLFKQIRHDVVSQQKRPDGRKIDEIRPINIAVGILPRTHGSALFQRGLTQVLTVVTLGSPRLEQFIESAEGEETKRYIHHYSMPPYSVGEVGRMGTPSRREIGHGALAERALEPVIPSQDKFPYTIRVVSEVLSSNGSTSMAATCGSTLALMDAGVPIAKPVAGISIGRMSEGDKSVLLTDIIGLEDFSGDMDFKVAGTDEGITAIQLDVKIPGLILSEIKEILERARIARLAILEKMLATLPTSRAEVSVYAPKIEQLQIPIDKIGELIGPGGRVIRNIIAQTGTTVDVEDDGTVTISGTEEEAVKRAVEWIEGLTREVVPGEIFEGPVKRILPFGAFVEILPGKEGMVHVSKMGKGYIKSPEEVLSVGQIVKVKVSEIDDQGRINLTMQVDEDRPNDSEAGKGEIHGQRRARGGFSPRSERQRSKHPLAQQFERERMLQTRSGRQKTHRRTHY